MLSSCTSTGPSRSAASTALFSSHKRTTGVDGSVDANGIVRGACAGKKCRAEGAGQRGQAGGVKQARLSVPPLAPDHWKTPPGPRGMSVAVRPSTSASFGRQAGGHDGWRTGESGEGRGEAGRGGGLGNGRGGAQRMSGAREGRAVALPYLLLG